MSEEEQNQDQKKALLTLAIELGDKKKQLLNIYLDSKPEQERRSLSRAETAQPRT